MRANQTKKMILTYISMFSILLYSKYAYCMYPFSDSHIQSSKRKSRPLDNLLVKDLHRVISYEVEEVGSRSRSSPTVTTAKKALEYMLRATDKSEISRILNFPKILSVEDYPVYRIRSHADLINKLFRVSELFIGSQSRKLRRDIAADDCLKTNICLQLIVSNLIARQIFTVLKITPLADEMQIEFYINQKIEQTNTVNLSALSSTQEAQNQRGQNRKFFTVYDELQGLCCGRIRQAFSNLSICELTHYIDKYLDICDEYNGQEFCDYILRKDLNKKNPFSDSLDILSPSQGYLDGGQCLGCSKRYSPNSSVRMHPVTGMYDRSNRNSMDFAGHRKNMFYTGGSKSTECNPEMEEPPTCIAPPIPSKAYSSRTLERFRRDSDRDGNRESSIYLVPDRYNPNRPFSELTKSNSESTLVGSQHTYESIVTRRPPSRYAREQEEPSQRSLSAKPTDSHSYSGGSVQIPMKKPKKKNRLMRQMSKMFSFLPWGSSDTNRSERSRSASATQRVSANSSCASSPDRSSRNLRNARSPSVAAARRPSQEFTPIRQSRLSRESTYSNETIKASSDSSLEVEVEAEVDYPKKYIAEVPIKAQPSAKSSPRHLKRTETMRPANLELFPEPSHAPEYNPRRSHIEETNPKSRPNTPPNTPTKHTEISLSKLTEALESKERAESSASCSQNYVSVPAIVMKVDRTSTSASPMQKEQREETSQLEVPRSSSASRVKMRELPKKYNIDATGESQEGKEMQEKEFLHLQSLISSHKKDKNNPQKAHKRTDGEKKSNVDSSLCVEGPYFSHTLNGIDKKKSAPGTSGTQQLKNTSTMSKNFDELEVIIHDMEKSIEDLLKARPGGLFKKEDNISEEYPRLT
ncbi:hypothetical protein NEAUS07_1596 [Nematocida ausubeli]|nr:hypothetical protein NEAUS07_1596 [Nematocida ausubeli]